MVGSGPPQDERLVRTWSGGGAKTSYCLLALNVSRADRAADGTATRVISPLIATSTGNTVGTRSMNQPVRSLRNNETAVVTIWRQFLLLP
jgi:hypothetical protein